MATIGNYGTGPYAVCIEVGSHFKPDDVHTQRFEDAAEALEYYRRHRADDGQIFGNCLPVYRQTKMNRTLRIASK